MPLSQNEIHTLIEKLRAKYLDYAEKFNPKWFSIDAFEDRMQMALRNRMNLEAFILAEISNFEKIKEKYESQKNQTSFSDKVDKIIEEQLEKIKKYPYIDIHPRAGIEIKHLYGVLIDISSNYFPIFWSIIQDSSLRNRLHILEEELSNLAAPRKNNLSKKVEDYYLLVSRPRVSDLEIEKGQNNLLKESAFVLHKIVDYCEEALNSQDSTLEMPVQFNKTYFSPDRKKKIMELFSNSTGYGAVLKIKELAENVLNDFRLTAFKQRI